IAFVRRGYSVEWIPDDSSWMNVFVPSRVLPSRRDLVAFTQFYRDPSKFGINGGRVSKLLIMGRGAPRETWYHYDRGLDVDVLEQNPEAWKLYDAVIEELN
ncbi:MAG: hypothetical protein L0177_18370, partial [Chloroflexi bacterium]|nr:hypothetical protein [Chloroflexota bacterium]